MDDIKIMAEQNTYDSGTEDIRKFVDQKENPLWMFVQTVNMLHDQVRKEELKFAAETKHVPVKEVESLIKHKYIEPHVFVMLGSINNFIEWYTKEYDTSLANYISKYLGKKSQDLYFSGIKVGMYGQDFEKVHMIIDALSAKFYQEVLLAITECFALKHKAFRATINDSKTGYVFSFRNYNLLELDELRKFNRIPINPTE